MKQARYKEPLPLAVIEAARAGDAGAVEQVLQYYNGYINKLCTRTLYDDCGQLHVCVPRYESPPERRPAHCRIAVCARVPSR